MGYIIGVAGDNGENMETTMLLYYNRVHIRVVILLKWIKYGLGYVITIGPSVSFLQRSDSSLGLLGFRVWGFRASGFPVLRLYVRGFRP